MLLPLLLSTNLLTCGIQQGDGHLFAASVASDDAGVLTLTTVSCTLRQGVCGEGAETDRYSPMTKTRNGGYAGTGVSMLPLFEGGFRLSGEEGTVMDFPARSCR